MSEPKPVLVLRGLAAKSSSSTLPLSSHFTTTTLSRHDRRRRVRAVGGGRDEANVAD